MLTGPWDRWTRTAFLAAIGLVCIATVRIGFSIVEQTNPDPDQFDQGAYMQMAAVMRQSWYPWHTDGTRNPLFPWLAARLVDPQSDGFFAAGKKINILLAAAGTAMLALAFSRRLGPLAAFNATLLGNLAVLLPLGTFFGAEVVFCVVFFLLWITASRLLCENPLWLHAVLGVLAGVCWLAKPSATPFLAAFVALGVVQAGLKFLRLPVPAWWQTPGWRPARFFAGMALVAGLFFALIAPRLVHAQRTWGSAFYSLPSFWFWADDWETCTTKYYDCRAVTLAKLPPGEQPTLAGYLRRHTIGDAIERMRVGTQRRLEQFFAPEDKFRIPFERSGRPRRIVLPHRGWYVVGLAGLAAALALLARRNWSRLTSAGWPTLLGLGAFIGYVVLTGWYLPTGPGHRFILALYIPVVWMLSQGAEQFRVAAGSRPATMLFLAAHAALFVLLTVRLGALTVSPNFEKIIYTF